MLQQRLSEVNKYLYFQVIQYPLKDNCQVFWRVGNCPSLPGKHAPSVDTGRVETRGDNLQKTSAALKNNPFRFSIFTENGLVKVPLDVVKHFCLLEFEIVAI